ncbi:MAG TPA: hypothetical protein VK776_13835 [Bryobacteraceae bacterium]|jgi:hypothetical protein|nr:hypothetical protein [Bryobacteraceae bacterium]
MIRLTITPMRLATHRNAIKSQGVPVNDDAPGAPIILNGMAPNTMIGLIALRNCTTSAINQDG